MRTHRQIVVCLLACSATLGCRSTQDKLDEIRELKQAASTSRDVANDMHLRGDRNPEQRTAWEQRASDALGKASRLEAEVESRPPPVPVPETEPGWLTEQLGGP